jgi:hypothetical protein
MDDLRHEQQLIYHAIQEKFVPSTILVLKKILQEKQQGIWYARLACMTADQNRIIACIVPLEPWHTMNSTSPLDQLRWLGFQTRESTDQALLSSLPPLQACPVRPKMSDLSEQILRSKSVKFSVKLKGDVAWTYLSDQLPSLRVDLLKAKDTQEFLNQGSLEQCLDIFQTCLAFQLSP